MAESAVAETPVATTDSTVSTPISEETQVLTPVQGEETTPAQGTETPAPEEAVVTPEAVKPLEQWSLDELNAKAYKDGLSAEETRRRDSLQQADVDRRFQEAQRLQNMRQQDAHRTQQIETSRAQLKVDLAALDESQALHGGDPELYATRRAELIDRHDSVVAQATMQPHLSGLREAVLRLTGDTVQNRQAANARDLPELVSDLYRFAYDAGRKAGAPEGYEAKKASDWKSEKDAAIKSALDDYKAKNPPAGLPSTGGANTAAGTKTYATMTPEERSKLSPAERDRLIAAQYGTR